MKITGGCHCGAIGYEADIDPEAVSICHCTDCQTLSGTAFRTAVPAKPGSFRMTGTPKHYIKTGSSGARRAQGFCENCGTQIYGTGADDDIKVYMIRAGTADQRNELTPRRMIWCRSAVPWLDGIGGMDRVERSPNG